MKNVYKPYSILSHLLCLILFFFIGVLFAKWIEAGKGQMLAAGAIVLSYGIVAAFIGLCISIFASYRLSKKNMIRSNLISIVLIICLWTYFYVAHKKRQQEKNQKQKVEQLKKTTTFQDNN